MLEVMLPLKIASELNLREHWTKKHRRHILQRKIVQLALHPHRHAITLPCCVTLIRMAPRSLDDDNLLGAFKSIRDYVADILIPGLPMGRADQDPRITWKYQQNKCKYYSCKILIEDQYVRDSTQGMHHV